MDDGRGEAVGGGAQDQLQPVRHPRVGLGRTGRRVHQPGVSEGDEAVEGEQGGLGSMWDRVGTD
jgi:hypothetical protein